MKIANSFNDFIDKVSQAERKVLNTEAGQKLTQELLKMKLAENPNMTPEAMSALGDHLYNELRKEG